MCWFELPLRDQNLKMRLTVLVAMSCGLALGELPSCVVDSADARQLDTEICEVSGGCAELTVRWCAAQCRAASFALADTAAPVLIVVV